MIGTSIGAINASLIAGNDAGGSPGAAARNSGAASSMVRFSRPMSSLPLFGGMAANWLTMAGGIANFFKPNPYAFAGAHVPLGADAAGYYSTAPLEATLGDLVDFDTDQPRGHAADGRRRQRAHQRDALLRQPDHAVSMPGM